MNVHPDTRQMSEEISNIRSKLDAQEASRIRAVRGALSANDTSVIVDVRAIRSNPKLLKEFDSGYSFALRFWEVALFVLFWGGVLLSFAWKWWIFLPATLMFWFLHKGQDVSAYQFTTDVIRKNAKADWLIASGYVRLPTDP